MRQFSLFSFKVLLMAICLLPTISVAQYTKLFDFSTSLPSAGSSPEGSLISDGTYLYGMTYGAGANDEGTIFKIKPDGTGHAILHNFTDTDGSNPTGSLISDGTYLYGMTIGGGANVSGVIFRIKLNGTNYEVLWDFDWTDGSEPSGSLFSDGTYLYGTTSRGGLNNEGVIFKIKPDGSGYNNIFDFNNANGSSPRGALISDGTSLYGMTPFGGSNGYGNIFKINPNGTGFVELFAFNSSDGNRPFGSLISDGTYFYGMTSNSCGNIFKIKHDGTGFTVLKSFSYPGTDGCSPYGDLIYDGTFLYGMTESGGGTHGNIFKIKTDGTGFSDIVDFSGSKGNTPGSYPKGSLYSDGTFLYGMTTDGASGFKLGNIFKVKTDGTGFMELKYFYNNNTNGSSPNGSLTSDGTYLYGMATNGGSKGYGNIFKIKSDGSGFVELFAFNEINGSKPKGSLVLDGTFLYGMTSLGGVNGYGTIFKLKTDGTGFTTLLDFNVTNGMWPTGDLIFDGTYLYGMTPYGGVSQSGNIFKIKPDGSGFTNLKDFDSSVNGVQPLGSLYYDGTYLYGMASDCSAGCRGTIFKIKPNGTGFVEFLIFDGVNGGHPGGSLISDGTYLYGMSDYDESLANIFKIKPDGTGFTQLINFNANYVIGNTGNYNNRANPHGSLTYDGAFLYGMAEYYGNGYGSIFKIKPDGSGMTNLYDFTATLQNNLPGSLISDGANLYGMQCGGGTLDSGTIFKYQFCTAPNASVSVSGSTLTANNSNATFQWLDCDNNNKPLTGETNQVYHSTVPGNYSVVISENGCKATSSCNFINVGCSVSYTTNYDTLQNRFNLMVAPITTAPAVSYLWDFGDGHTSTLVAPSHVYALDTTYNVCLKTKTASNDSCTFCHTIGKDHLGNIYRTSGFTLNVINSNITDISSISSNENSVRIFPNPTNGETEIMFDHSLNNVSVKVMNVTGQKILENTSVSGSHFSIDISNQSAGIYFVEVLSDGNVYRQKLIKQ